MLQEVCNQGQITTNAVRTIFMAAVGQQHALMDMLSVSFWYRLAEKKRERKTRFVLALTQGCI